MTNSSDPELVKICLSGNKKAFDILVERYHVPMYRTVYGIVKDVEQAKDIVQIGFIKSWEKLHTYKADYKFSNWLYRIMINESLNNERRRKVHDKLQSEPIDSNTPFHQMSEKETKKALSKSIDELSSIYRVVIQLRHFEEMSYAEISETLGIDVKTVKSRLYTARMQLREKLYKR